MQRSIIRWAGSKRKLIPQLKELSPKCFDRYIEPFCGSACFFFQEVDVENIILSDLNEELINALKVLRTSPIKLHKECISIPKNEESYYRIRSIKISQLSKFDKAVRFFYLNKYGFNGVYRTNKKGEYNVPMGKNTGNFAPLDFFTEAAKKLKGVKLASSDFVKSCKLPREGDFFYLDPPYYSRSTKCKGEYGTGSFTDDDQIRLVEYLETIHKKGAKFMLSYKDSPEVLEKLQTYCYVKHILVDRHVAGFAKHRGQANEVLIRNYQS